MEKGKYYIYNITILGILGTPNIYKFHAVFSITVCSMAPKKCEHHDSPVNSSVSISWTVKLFDYPGSVKVWSYQVVSCCIHNISNSFDFPILHWEPHGARNEVSESHDSWSPGVFIRVVMWKVVQYIAVPPTNDAEVNEVSVNFGYNT